MNAMPMQLADSNNNEASMPQYAARGIIDPSTPESAARGKIERRNGELRTPTPESAARDPLNAQPNAEAGIDEGLNRGR